MTKEISSIPGSTETNESFRDKEHNLSQEFETNKDVRQISGNDDSRSYPISVHYGGEDSQYDDEIYQNARFSEDRRDSSDNFASTSEGFRLPSGLTGGFGAQLGGRRSMS